jgi:selenide,water dikinase
MATMNLNGAILIRKYDVKACTDVTGFGLLGHSRYLAEA